MRRLRTWGRFRGLLSLLLAVLMLISLTETEGAESPISGPPSSVIQPPPYSVLTAYRADPTETFSPGQSCKSDVNLVICRTVADVLSDGGRFIELASKNPTGKETHVLETSTWNYGVSINVAPSNTLPVRITSATITANPTTGWVSFADTTIDCHSSTCFRASYTASSSRLRFTRVEVDIPAAINNGQFLRIQTNVEVSLINTTIVTRQTANYAINTHASFNGRLTWKGGECRTDGAGAVRGTMAIENVTFKKLGGISNIRAFLTPLGNSASSCKKCSFDGGRVFDFETPDAEFDCQECTFRDTTIMEGALPTGAAVSFTKMRVYNVDYGNNPLLKAENTMFTGLSINLLDQIQAGSFIATNRGLTLSGGTVEASTFVNGFIAISGTVSNPMHFELDGLTFIDSVFPNGLFRPTGNSGSDTFTLKNLEVFDCHFEAPVVHLPSQWTLNDGLHGATRNRVLGSFGTVLITIQGSSIFYKPTVIFRKRSGGPLFIENEATCTDTTTFNADETIIKEDATLSCGLPGAQMVFTNDLVVSGTLEVGGAYPARIDVSGSTQLDSETSQLHLNNMSPGSSLGTDVVVEKGEVHISPQSGTHSIVDDTITIGENATLVLKTSASSLTSGIIYTTNNWVINGTISVDWHGDPGNVDIPMIQSTGTIEFNGNIATSNFLGTMNWRVTTADTLSTLYFFKPSSGGGGGGTGTDQAAEGIASDEMPEWMWIAIGGSIGGLLLIVIIIVIIVVVVSRKRKKSKDGRDSSMEMASRAQMEHVYAHIPVLMNKNLQDFGDAIVEFGELEFGQKLGSGSFGEVYEAQCRGETVAAKLCSSAAEDAIEEFLHEAKLMSRLPPHPNVVDFKGIAFTETSNPVLLIELCSGGPLKSYLEERGPQMSMHEKRVMMFAIADGMRHLGNNGIVHRDLAARNVLLASDGTPKVSDFGMSRVLASDAEGAHTKQDVGPVRWMAPEALAREYSTKSDVWSYGCLVYEIVTDGLNPYHEETDVIKVAHAVAYEGRTPRIPESVDDSMKLLMEQCWAQDANERPTFDNICEYFQTL